MVALVILTRAIADGQYVMPSAASKSTCFGWRGRSPLHTKLAVAASGRCSTRTGTMLHIELALFPSQWLGAAVLRQISAPRP